MMRLGLLLLTSWLFGVVSSSSSSAAGALWGKDNPVEIIILTDRIEPTSALLDSVCANTQSFLAFHVVVPDVREELAASILPASCDGSTLKIYTESGIVASIRALGLPTTWEVEVPTTPHTVQVASWDHGAKHNSVFNCLRFYLALLPEFGHLEQIIFMDDDVVLRGDIAKLWDFPQAQAISAGCLNWIWNDCGRMEASLNFSYVDVPYFGFGSMTGDRHEVANVTCQSIDEEECAPPGFFDTLAEASAEIIDPKVGKVLTVDELRSKRAWNFGLNKFNLTAWRSKDLTDVYFKWIDANAHYGWFPTSSLAYGLGIPFLALADDMVCMDDELPILHGLGFVEADDLMRSAEVADRGIETYYALHWNGDRKPWLWEVAIDEYADFFLAHAPKIKQEYQVKREQVALAADVRKKAKTNSFLVWTAPRSGSEWFMSVLDRHPNICASGETQSSGRGWPREALLLREATEWADVCQPKAVCHWSITARLLESLLQETVKGQHLPEICYATQAEAANYSYYGSHLGTICALLNRAIIVAAAETGDHNAPAGSETPDYWHQRVMQAAFHYFVAHVLGGDKPGDDIFAHIASGESSAAAQDPTKGGVLNPDDRLFHASFAQDVQLPCSCPLHTTVTGLKVMGGWLRPPPKQQLADSSALSDSLLAAASQQQQRALGGYNLTGVISQLGSKLIILDRMNLVSSYISLRIGQTLGSFHCSGKNCKTHDLRVNIQTDRLVQFLKQTIAQRVARNALLESMDVEVLHVEYEACVAAPRDCFDRVLDFIDVDADDVVLDSLLATTEGASLTRDARSLRDRVANFDNVATGLNKAGFGHFLTIGQPGSEATIKRSTSVGGVILDPAAAAANKRDEEMSGKQDETSAAPKTHVALLSDRAYAIAATLTSVCLHASDVESLVFHLVLPNDETDPAWDVKDVLDSCAGATFDLRSMASVEKEVRDKLRGEGAVWTSWGDAADSEEEEEAPAKLMRNAALNVKDAKHTSPFNLARFYLPLLDAFDSVDRLVLLDDDVLVQGDILDADATALRESHATVVAGCQNWGVEDAPQEATRKSRKLTSSVLMNVLETPYLGFNGVPRGAHYSKALCSSPGQQNCMPANFLTDLASARDEVRCKLRQTGCAASTTTAEQVGSLLQAEPAWNWGLASINVPQWRANNLSLSYHEWVEAVESRGLFVRGSLAHGLGVGIVALLGRVQCWESALDPNAAGSPDISVLQGLGFVTPADLEAVGIDADDAFALHFNGENKPWTDKSPFKAKWDDYSSASYLDHPDEEVFLEETADSSFRRRKLIERKKADAERRLAAETHRQLGGYKGYKSNYKSGYKGYKSNYKKDYKKADDMYVKNLYVKNFYVKDMKKPPKPPVPYPRPTMPPVPQPTPDFDVVPTSYLPAPTPQVSILGDDPIPTPAPPSPKPYGYPPPKPYGGGGGGYGGPPGDPLSPYEKKQIKKMIKKALKKEEEEEMYKAYKQHLKYADYYYDKKQGY